MKKLSVRSLLLGVVLAVVFMQAGVLSTDGIGNCGMPYTRLEFRTIVIPAPWGGIVTIPWLETVGCADCDGGTYCYALD